MRLTLLLITHFISDFLLQSRKMGENKSSNYKYLSLHVGIIFLSFLPFGLKFSLLNALIHGIIDKNIWFIYKLYAMNVMRKGKNNIVFSYPDYSHGSGCDKGKEWKYWNDKWFYVTIGLDQLLHTLTIIFLSNY